MNKEKLVPGNIKIDGAFQGKQLSACFNIKNKAEFPHKHDLVYHSNVLMKNETMTMSVKQQGRSLKQ